MRRTNVTKSEQPWGLFDADDTLIGLEIDGKVVGTSLGYELCIILLCNAMGRLGFEEKLVRETQFSIDVMRCKKEGFSRRRRFPISFRDTYIALTKLAGLRPNREISIFMENLGWKVFEFRAAPLPGAHIVLETVAKDYNMAIVTKGNTAQQIEKLGTSSCSQYARKIIAMRTKSTSEWEKKIQYVLGIREFDREKSWVVGDSIKSDINPALDLGFSAIHIPAEKWAFENAEYGTAKENAQLKVVNKIEEVLDCLPFK